MPKRKMTNAEIESNERKAIITMVCVISFFLLGAAMSPDMAFAFLISIILVFISFMVGIAQLEDQKTVVPVPKKDSLSVDTIHLGDFEDRISEIYQRKGMSLEDLKKLFNFLFISKYSQSHKYLNISGLLQKFDPSVKHSLIVFIKKNIDFKSISGLYLETNNNLNYYPPELLDRISNEMRKKKFGCAKDFISKFNIPSYDIEELCSSLILDVKVDSDIHSTYFTKNISYYIILTKIDWGIIQKYLDSNAGFGSNIGLVFQSVPYEVWKDFFDVKKLNVIGFNGRFFSIPGMISYIKTQDGNEEREQTYYIIQKQLQDGKISPNQEGLIGKLLQGYKYGIDTTSDNMVTYLHPSDIQQLRIRVHNYVKIVTKSGDWINVQVLSSDSVERGTIIVNEDVLTSASIIDGDIVTLELTKGNDNNQPVDPPDARTLNHLSSNLAFFLKINHCTCSICRTYISPNDQSLSCSWCSTRFHLTHFAEWIRRKGSCPICKKTIISDVSKSTILSNFKRHIVRDDLVGEDPYQRRFESLITIIQEQTRLPTKTVQTLVQDKKRMFFPGFQHKSSTDFQAICLIAADFNLEHGVIWDKVANKFKWVGGSNEI